MGVISGIGNAIGNVGKSVKEIVTGKPYVPPINPNAGKVSGGSSNIAGGGAIGTGQPSTISKVTGGVSSTKQSAQNIANNSKNQPAGYVSGGGSSGNRGGGSSGGGGSGSSGPSQGPTNYNVATDVTSKNQPTSNTPQVNPNQPTQFKQPSPNSISSYSGIAAPVSQQTWFDKSVDFITGKKSNTVNLGGYRGSVGGENTYKRDTGITALQKREIVNPDISKPAVVIQAQVQEKVVKDISKDVNKEAQAKVNERQTYYQEQVDKGVMDVTTATASLKAEVNTINTQASNTLNERVNAEIPKALQTPDVKQKLKESASFRKDYTNYEKTLVTPTQKVKSVGKAVGETAIAFVPVANVVYGARQQVKAQETIKQDGGLFGLNPFQEQIESKARSQLSSANAMYGAAVLTGINAPFKAAKEITIERLNELSRTQYKVLGEEVARVGDTTLVRARAFKTIKGGTAEAYSTITTPLIETGGGKIAIGTSKGESQVVVEDFLKSLQQGKPVYLKGTQKFTSAGTATISKTNIENVFKSSGKGYIVTGEKVTPIKFGGLSKNFDNFYAIAGGKQRSVIVKELQPKAVKILPSGKVSAIPNREYAGRFNIEQFGFIKKLPNEVDFGGFKVTNTGGRQTTEQVTKQETSQLSGGFLDTIAKTIEKQVIPKVTVRQEEVQVAKATTKQMNSLYYPEQVTKQQGKAVTTQVAKQITMQELTKTRQTPIVITDTIQTPRYVQVEQTAQIQLQSSKQINKQIQQLSQINYIPTITTPVRPIGIIGGFDIPPFGAFGNLPQGNKNRPKIARVKPTRRKPKYTASLAAAAFQVNPTKVTKAQYDKLSSVTFSGVENRPVLEIVSDKEFNKQLKKVKF